MIATATLVVGIVRAVIEWPSYELSVLDEHPLPLIAGVVPGKHTTRKGWLTKDFQYPGQSPFTTDVDSRVWRMRDGTLMSLRAIARQIAWYFRPSIRRHADPFSVRHLFAILNGRAPSMLELPDRPARLRRRRPADPLGHGAARRCRAWPAAATPDMAHGVAATSRSPRSSTRATRSARPTGAR